MVNRKNWSIELAETIMRKYPNPDDFPYKSWSYPQGFMLWGMEKLWEYTGDSKYFDYVLKYADVHVDMAGNISEFAGNSLDDIMAGSILVWAYKQTGLDKYRLACGKVRKVFDTYPRLADSGFWHADWSPREMWIDGLFMGQMFLMKYGKYVADSDWCFNEAARQLQLAYQHCRKENTGLLYHAWSEDKKANWADPVIGCAPEVWSEGLGWYALILVETLEIFPLDHPKRDQIVMQLSKLLESLKNEQDEKTGLWYQVVDKGHLADNWHDTSGSAMFTYSIAKAVELGLADAGTFEPVVRRGFEGIIKKAKINDAGLVDIYDACNGLGVQDNYTAYINFKKTVNAQEAVAAFLWATGIVEKKDNRMYA